MFGGNGKVRRRPRTAADFKALAGITLDSAWLFEAAAGNVPDLIGSNHLVVVGAPTFGSIFKGRPGVDYPVSTAHRADVLAPGSTSLLYAAEVSRRPVTPGNNSNIIGRMNGSLSPCALMLFETAAGTGEFTVRINDGVSTVTAQSVYSNDGNHGSADPYLCMLLIDRNAATASALITVGDGSYDLISASIAGFGSLSGVQTFGVASRGYVGEVRAHYGFARVNADVEGLDLPLLAARMGWL